MTADSGGLAGPVARDALDALVGQFSQRSAMVRELVQNSLDASASRVDLRVVQEKKRLLVEVIDDGEGMDRDTIEGCLLTLFRSSKEDDLTKIGKFGVGFVSLFALEPQEVVVETGRDGQGWRVVFDHKRDYRLFALDHPVEGTTVRLVLKLRGKQARALAEELDEALHHWCRFARAEIWSEGCGRGWGWAPKEVTGDFSVDAPVWVEVEEPGFRAVLGLSGHHASHVAWLNRGLTLLEGPEDAIPGVTFRVEAAVLEHTLTRDNVLRDAAFAGVLRKLRRLAQGPLQERWRSELARACSTGNEDRRRALLAVAWPGVAEPPEDLACFRTPTGTLRCLGQLRPGLLRRRTAELVWAGPDTRLGRALERAGHTVLCGPAPEHPDALVAHRLGCGVLRDATERWWAAEPQEPPELLVQADALGRATGVETAGLYAARLAPGPAAERLALRLRDPEAVQSASATAGDKSGVLVVNLDHRHVQQLCALPPALAAPLLLRSAQAAADGVAPLAPPLAAALGQAVDQLGEGAP